MSLFAFITPTLPVHKGLDNVFTTNTHVIKRRKDMTSFPTRQARMIHTSADSLTPVHAAAANAAVSRRDVLRALGLTAAGVTLASSSCIPAAHAAGNIPAAVASQVEIYKDLNKGFQILRPQGWNQFDATPDSYDVKWQDVIQPLETVVVVTTPVSKGKNISDLGDVQAVAQKLANSRKGNVVTAYEKETDNIKSYIVEISDGKAHQLNNLTIAKSKLYISTATCAENRWAKREKIYRIIVESFLPKL